MGVVQKGPLLTCVEEALALPADEREAAVPAAVQMLLSTSDDVAESARTLLKAVDGVRSQLPATAGPLLERMADALKSELRKGDAIETVDAAFGSGDEIGSDGATAGASTDAEAITSDVQRNREDNGTHDGTAFCLGRTRMQLAPLLNIVGCLEPDDLNPTAAACKSFCIPININLQYMLFLVRLLRLIVLGPEVVAMMNERDTSDGDSTVASSYEG